MNQKFVCLGSWVDKTTGEPLSSIAEISSGVGKNGQPFEFAETRKTVKIHGQHRVGAIITATMSFSTGIPAEKQSSKMPSMSRIKTATSAPTPATPPDNPTPTNSAIGDIVNTAINAGAKAVAEGVTKSMTQFG